MYALLKTVHLLSVVVWIGGMFFAHFCLRPAAQNLAPAERIALMQATLARFFAVVTVASAASLASGAWLMGRVVVASASAGIAAPMPLEWHLMAVLGLVMIGVFLYVRLVPYPRLSQAVGAADWPAGAAALARIRTLVAVNLGIGLAIIVVTQIGNGG